MALPIGIAPQQTVIGAAGARLPPQRRVIFDPLPAGDLRQVDPRRDRRVEPVGRHRPALRRRHQQRHRAEQRGQADPQRAQPREQRRRQQRHVIDQRLVRRTVEPAPARRNHNGDHDSEEYPAINDVIEAASISRALELRDIDRAPRTHAVGQHRNRDRHGHERRAARPAFEADVADQHPQRDHRDQELDARTRLGHFEQPGRGIDEHPVNRRRYAGHVNQRDGQRGRHRLERLDQFVAERHKERHVTQRKGQPRPDPRPQKSQNRRTQHPHRARLLAKRKPRERAKHPQHQRRAEQHQPRPPWRRNHALQLRPALPHQPAQNHRDEQDVVIGRAVPPLPGHLRPGPSEHGKQDQRCPQQRRQRHAPQLRDGRRKPAQGRRFRPNLRRHLRRHAARRPARPMARSGRPNRPAPPASCAFPRPAAARQGPWRGRGADRSAAR